MKTTMNQVREFQAIFDGAHLPERPELPDDRTQILRLHLITEELGELAHAICKGDLIKVLDGLCDLQYVIDGTALVCGLSYQSSVPTLFSIDDEPRMARFPCTTIARLTKGLAQLADAFSYKSLPSVQLALMNLDNALQLAFMDFGMGAIKDAAFAEVHRSNMSKAGPDGKPVTDGAGRVVKGPSYSPANLGQFLPREYFTEEVMRDPTAGQRRQELTAHP
jgi:predicted HAD superfamily Cof-like phosphohydrolase